MTIELAEAESDQHHKANKRKNQCRWKRSRECKKSNSEHRSGKRSLRDGGENCIELRTRIENRKTTKTTEKENQTR
jgi:hypothetical protein